jgi:tetratricopeptide (TPR) repeat protein
MRFALAAWMLTRLTVTVALLLPHAQVQPREVDRLTDTAETERWNGRFDQAMAMYREAIALNPGNVRARLGLAHALDFTGQHAEARAQYQALLDGTAKPPAYIFSGLATSYVFDRHFAEARAALQRWADLTPARAGRDVEEAVAFFEVAVAGGAFDEAERLIERQYAPIEKPAPMVSSPTLDRHALMDRLQWMRYTAARAAMSARAGRAADARRWIAEAEAQARNIQDALTAFTAATGADTGGLKPYDHLAPTAGEVAFYLGDTAGAIRLLSNAPNKSPRFNLVLGQAYEREGQRNEARAAYAAVLKEGSLTIEVAWARPIAQERLAALGR